MSYLPRRAVSAFDSAGLHSIAVRIPTSRRLRVWGPFHEIARFGALVALASVALASMA